MSGKNPTVLIHDTVFYIDIANRRFSRVGNMCATISFYEARKDGDQYYIFFDTKTRSVFKGTESARRRSQTVVKARIPSPRDIARLMIRQPLLDDQARNILIREAIAITNYKQRRETQPRKPKRKR